MFVISTTAKDIPFVYAKVYLIVTLLDAGLFWLWGNSFTNIYAWMLFSIDVAKVAFAYILFQGVPQRNMLKCKAFCFGEVILILLGILSLTIQILTIGHIVWFIIVVAFRAYGVRLIGTYIRMVETELGRTSTYPWTYFPEPVDAKNQANIGEYPEPAP